MSESYPDQRLIVALDFADSGSANALIRQLGDLVNFYKIGLGMIGSGGLELAGRLKKEEGKRVFLDLKLFDIASTVSAAVKSVLSLDPDFLTVQGEPHIVRAAVQARESAPMRILAVTFLTSLNRKDLDESMIAEGKMSDITLERASRALTCGADGIICSPLEANHIRNLDQAAGKLIVTPGVRPSGARHNGQKRIASPAESLNNGADHLVIGRPITQSANPCAAVRQILSELPEPVMEVT